MTGDTFTPCVGSVTSPGIDGGRDQRPLVFHPNNTPFQLTFRMPGARRVSCTQLLGSIFMLPNGCL